MLVLISISEHLCYRNIYMCVCVCVYTLYIYYIYINGRGGNLIVADL